MKWFVFLFSDACLQCAHYRPYLYENTLELSTCAKFNNRYADMCRMDEGKCGKEAKHFSPKKDNDNHNDNNKKITFKYGMTQEMYELREKQHLLEMESE
jgi:hypothetical protein